MKHLILLSLAFCLFLPTAYAQCPPGTRARIRTVRTCRYVPGRRVVRRVCTWRRVPFGFGRRVCRRVWVRRVVWRRVCPFWGRRCRLVRVVRNYPRVICNRWGPRFGTRRFCRNVVVGGGFGRRICTVRRVVRCV